VEAYDGPQIVGMDLHWRRSVLVRMTPDGRRLETARITNSPADLRREIARAEEYRRGIGDIRRFSGPACGAAAPLIDPAARTRNAPCPRGQPLREPRRDDRSRRPASQRDCPCGRTTAYLWSGASEYVPQRPAGPRKRDNPS
jgi:hypothetical protein